jgi:hypothetical protein
MATWMKWLVVLVFVLAITVVPSASTWAHNKPAPSPPQPGQSGPGATVAGNANAEAGFIWWVMDRNRPTIRLAGPFYNEQECRTRAATMNAICRTVRD